MNPSELFPYQKKIVDSINSTTTPLFMGMGTGKTITSLNIYKKFKTNKILIVCLISKINDWEEDLYKECGIKATVLRNPSKINNQIVRSEKDNKAYIINFESVWRCPELINWVDKDTTVLLDESQLIKNPTSKIGRFARLLGSRTQHKMILTGTPQSKGYIDYYNQLYFCGLIKMSFKQFKDKYCVFDNKFYNGFKVKT